MDEFDKLVAHILDSEGGVANHPDDPGGLTNKGVTWETFKRLAYPVLGIAPTQANLLSLTDNQVARIIYYFWQDIGGDQITNKLISSILTEWSWGSGPQSAGITIQRILNTDFGKQLSIDGVIGPKTIDAINQVIKSGQTERLFSLLIEAREQFFINLGKIRPSLQQFVDGWLNRLDNYVSSTLEFLQAHKFKIGGLLAALAVTGVVLYQNSRKAA